jgi:MFS family permease
MGLHSVMAGLRLAASLQALREGYSAWAVGFLLALFAAAPVLSALWAGRYADRWGYHRPVHLAVCLAMAGATVAVISTFVDGALHFALLCLAAMATGSGANIGMLTIQRTAGLAARDNTERVRIFSWLGVAPSFSNVLGSVAVGLLIDLSGFAAAYAFLSLLPALTLATSRLVPQLPKQEPVAAAQGRRAWDLLQSPGLRRLLMVNWMLSSCWDVHMFAVPILGHGFGFNASTIGLISGTFTLSVTLVRLVIPTLAHRVREPTVMKWAMLATGAVFAVYPLASNAWAMAACSVLLGVSLGCVQPMLMSMLHQLTPDQRYGETLALRSMAMNASSTIMPLVFGATGTLVGAGVLFWAVGGVVAAGSTLVRQLERYLPQTRSKVGIGPAPKADDK